MSINTIYILLGFVSLSIIVCIVLLRENIEQNKKIGQILFNYFLFRDGRSIFAATSGQVRKEILSQSELEISKETGKIIQESFMFYCSGYNFIQNGMLLKKDADILKNEYAFFINLPNVKKQYEEHIKNNNLWDNDFKEFTEKLLGV